MRIEHDAPALRDDDGRLSRRSITVIPQRVDKFDNHKAPLAAPPAKSFALFIFPVWHKVCIALPEPLGEAALRLGEHRNMPQILDRMSLLAILLCSATLFVVTGAVQILPSHVALGLATWVLASVPLGIGIGHCILNEE